LEQRVAQDGQPAKPSEQTRKSLLRWLEDAGLHGEWEPEEFKFISTLVGRAEVRSQINGLWRNQGVGVLLWALGRFELQKFDEVKVADVPVDQIGYFSPVAELDAADPPRLRPEAEIDRLASHLTLVSWRLTQFTVSRESELYRQASADYPGLSGVQ